jgi:hypothetical protein
LDVVWLCRPCHLDYHHGAKLTPEEFDFFSQSFQS